MRNSEIVQSFVEAMMSSEVETMAQCLGLEVVWHPPTSVEQQFHSQVEGAESVISFLTENPEKFYETGSRTAEVLHVVSEGNLVSLHFNFHAKPRIGGTLCTCANWIFELNNKKIVQVWEVLDMAEWNNAVLSK